MFKQLEHGQLGQALNSQEIIAQLKYNADGLVPVIAQQHDSGEVLMMAWANEAAIRETLRTGRMCYWSRSRQAYWRKGESSGHEQHLVALRADCDGDTLLALVDQTGPACHTNRRNCFYIELTQDQGFINAEPLATKPTTGK